MLLFLSLAACQQVDQSVLQQQYLQDKIDDYRTYRWNNCQREILQEAEVRSDSFFVAMSKKRTFDSVQAPPPIRRPVQPESRIREDSTPLSPLWKKKPVEGDSLSKKDTL